jgi:hypothetical protein
MYPVDVPGLLKSALIGANGSDPTIPYSPGWPRRLGSALWLMARRNQQQPPPARSSTASSAATT